MANPTPPNPGEELSPEQQKFAETKQQQKATSAEHRSDRGTYRKSGRQQKEEEKEAKKAERPPAKPVTRREFLNYAWGAALGVVLVEAGLASFFFAVPRFKEGQFGGVFPLGTGSSLPPVDGPPVSNLDGQFWLSNDADGVRALYRVCTHLGCLYEWKNQTVRFECPCHGSKFQKTGQYIEGPAPRSLDQFQIAMVVGGDVAAQTSTGGEALPVQSDAEYVVNTGVILRGQPH